MFHKGRRSKTYQFFLSFTCRSMKKYAYENLITREVQFEKPDDEDEDDDVNEVINVKESPVQKGQ